MLEVVECIHYCFIQRPHIPEYHEQYLVKLLKMCWEDIPKVNPRLYLICLVFVYLLIYSVIHLFIVSLDPRLFACNTE